MNRVAICSIAIVLLFPAHAALGTLPVLPGGWVEQVYTPFEVRCTFLDVPLSPDYRYEIASMRFVLYTLLRERSFTISYDGHENMVLTTANAEVLRYELGFRDTPPGDSLVPGQYPMLFEPVANANSELGEIVVRYPERSLLPTWKDEFMFVEHTKRMRDHFGNWAYRTAAYTCATPTQIQQYQPEPELHCARVPFPGSTPEEGKLMFDCRSPPAGQ